MEAKEPHLAIDTRVRCTWMRGGSTRGTIMGYYRGKDGTGRNVWRYQIRHDGEHVSKAYDDRTFEYGFSLLTEEEDANWGKNNKWWKLW
jgi:hypothetical protein